MKALLLSLIATVTVACGVATGVKSNKHARIDQKPALDEVDIINGADQTAKPKPKERSQPDISATPEGKFFDGMNKYCRACHGVGSLRFVFTDDPREFVDYLKTARSPTSGRPLIPAIIDVLDWPEDDYPSFETRRGPRGDWMPIGAKRIHISEEEIDGQNARKYLINFLEGLGN